jgi:hypothetical protein
MIELVKGSHSGFRHSLVFEGGTMPVRFRRSFKIFPGVKVNVSKGGVSVSVGKPGATLNFSKHGVRQTIGLPGSGVSHTSYLFKNDSDSDTDEEADNESDKTPKRADPEEEEEEREVGCFPSSCFLILVLGAISLYIVAYNLKWIPATFLTDLLQVITQWLRGLGL